MQPLLSHQHSPFQRYSSCYGQDVVHPRQPTLSKSRPFSQTIGTYLRWRATSWQLLRGISPRQNLITLGYYPWLLTSTWHLLPSTGLLAMHPTSSLKIASATTLATLCSLKLRYPRVTAKVTCTAWGASAASGQLSGLSSLWSTERCRGSQSHPTLSPISTGRPLSSGTPRRGATMIYLPGSAVSRSTSTTKSFANLGWLYGGRTIENGKTTSKESKWEQGSLVLKFILLPERNKLI